MDENSVQLSVIIVTHNSAAVLADCLSALPAAAGAMPYETFVVDNASADNTTEIARQYHAAVTALSNNTGFAAACNTGAKMANGTFLVFLNPDVVPDPGSFDVLVSTAVDIADAGLISARLRHEDGSYQPTCRRFPSLTNLVFSRGSIFSRWFGQSERYTYGDFDDVASVEAVAGTFVGVWRERFNLVGGFDDRFFLFMEDTDLSKRMVEHGFRNCIVPSSGGVHRWGKGSDAPSRMRRRYHHRSMTVYARKHFNPGSRLVLRLMLTLNLALLPLFGRRTDRDI